MGQLIVLIHAVPAAIPPVLEAFGRLWPEAECVNLIEDSLSPDRARDGSLTARMHWTIRALADYAAEIGADGILFTCSAFGEAIEAAAARHPIPVLTPNEAMFEVALAAGRRIGMLATLEPSVASMEAEFQQAAKAHGIDATIRTICLPQAMTALKAGDGRAHDRLLSAVAPQLTECDAVLLAHFSTARAESAVAGAVAIPVLASPGSAIKKLRHALRVLA